MLRDIVIFLAGVAVGIICYIVLATLWFKKKYSALLDTLQMKGE